MPNFRPLPTNGAYKPLEVISRAVEAAMAADYQSFLLGKPVTVYLELPEPYGASGVVASSKKVVVSESSNPPGDIGLGSLWVRISSSTKARSLNLQTSANGAHLFYRSVPGFETLVPDSSRRFHQTPRSNFQR